MADQQGFEFDPQRHHQPPPVIPIRDGLAQQAPQQQQPRPAPPPAQPPRQLFTEPVRDVSPAYLQMARAVSQILATRVLLLIAVITASAIWGYTIYDPVQLRIIAASAFSVLGVLPLIGLYVKKG